MVCETDMILVFLTLLQPHYLVLGGLLTHHMRYVITPYFLLREFDLLSLILHPTLVPFFDTFAFVFVGVIFPDELGTAGC